MDMLQTNEQRYKQGLETLKELAGEDGIRPVEQIRQFSPDFGHTLVAFGFGDLWSRKVLDFKQREIITLTSLITQGAFDQLAFHVHAALNVGLKPEEIMELVMHCAGYAGFPKAVSAMNIVQQVLEQRGMTVTSLG